MSDFVLSFGPNNIGRQQSLEEVCVERDKLAARVAELTKELHIEKERIFTDLTARFEMLDKANKAEIAEAQAVYFYYKGVVEGVVRRCIDRMEESQEELWAEMKCVFNGGTSTMYELCAKLGINPETGKPVEEKLI